MGLLRCMHVQDLFIIAHQSKMTEGDINFLLKYTAAYVQKVLFTKQINASVV
jgi:hypothetical protein